jgi:hypothetical protein
MHIILAILKLDLEIDHQNPLNWALQNTDFEQTKNLVCALCYQMCKALLHHKSNFCRQHLDEGDH